MRQAAPRVRGVAIALAGVAGFVDVIGFLSLGGHFVAFMSGNTTQLAVDSADGRREAWLAGGLIAVFVAGVVAGTMAGQAAGPRRPTVVVALVAVLLAAAALIADAALPVAAVAVLALAMGVENAVFERDGEVAIGLTYMTGTLVKTGQQIATALSGGPRLNWLPYLGLWLGLLAGGVAGAFADRAIGFDAVWFAALAACGLAVVAPRG